mmetsp:Transcript_41917/g.125332  ORF Transcript_41917/g.125332 Transcript_41917/m.125332 type:complete len:118 (+) Transcript_41917:981-1334(+)
MSTESSSSILPPRSPVMSVPLTSIESGSMTRPACVDARGARMLEEASLLLDTEDMRLGCTVEDRTEERADEREPADCSKADACEADGASCTMLDTSARVSPSDCCSKSWANAVLRKL